MTKKLPTDPVDDITSDAAAVPLVEIDPVQAEEPASETAAFTPLVPPVAETGGANNLDLLLDVNLPLTVELGRARLLVRDVLKLGRGSILELDRLAGEPVDVLVSGTVVARGDVVVVDEKFGIRITQIVSREARP